MTTFYDFMDYLKILDVKDWRRGQALFNALYFYRPELANKIRGTELDPFYDDTIIPDCIEWIKRNWYDNDYLP